MQGNKSYQFLSALRVFSLSVAVVSCGLGIRLAWNPDAPQYGLAILLLLGGVLAQAGINLINDVEDLRLSVPTQANFHDRQQIRNNQRMGWVAFMLASVIGLYFVSLRGWPLLLVFGLSALFALSYNAGPFNFKHRGLAIVQVFVLMGLIMVETSFYVLSGQFSNQVLWLAIPTSLIISLLLISNEIRDYESDLQDGVRTLTVRIGLARAQQLYWLLLVLAFVLVFVFAHYLWLEHVWLISAPLLMMPLLKAHLYAEDRSRLTPLTGRFFLVLGAAYLLMIKPLVV